MRAEQRALPLGVQVKRVEKDGDCLFSSAAAILKALGKKEVEPFQLRAEVVTHLRKNKDKYELQWDRERR